MAGLSDDEFRRKIDAHFSLYRLNLRSPVVSHVVQQHWYRLEVFLVNEVGLFKRAAILPHGKVELGVELLVHTGKDATDWINEPCMGDLVVAPRTRVQVRASSWQGETAIAKTDVAGCYASGRGALEFAIDPSAPGNASEPDRPHYLRVFCSKATDFPQEQDASRVPAHLDDLIMPLVVGPIFLHNANDENATRAYLPTPNQPTHMPVEQWPANTPMSHATYRWFTLKDAQNDDDAKHIAIHEVWEEGIHGKVWDSALVMVHVIQTMARDNHFLPYIQGKHVVDLSAGTGLLGLCALHQGHPEKVTVTELDEAVPLIKSNVALNLGRDASRIQVMALSWGDKAAAAACGPADLILASDVLYESEFFEVLVQSLADLCSEKGRIYIGYKRRGLSIDDEARFWTLCEQHFAVTLLNDHPDDPDHRLVPELATQVGVKFYRLLRP